MILLLFLLKILIYEGITYFLAYCITFIYNFIPMYLYFIGNCRFVFNIHINKYFSTMYTLITINEQCMQRQ